MVEVRVKESKQAGEAIQDAVSTIACAAEYHQTGIMVTRVGPDSYIVRAHPSVPYGFVRQQHQ